MDCVPFGRVVCGSSVLAAVTDDVGSDAADFCDARLGEANCLEVLLGFASPAFCSDELIGCVVVPAAFRGDLGSVTFVEFDKFVLFDLFDASVAAVVV